MIGALGAKLKKRTTPIKGYSVGFGTTRACDAQTDTKRQREDTISSKSGQCGQNVLESEKRTSSVPRKEVPLLQRDRATRYISTGTFVLYVSLGIGVRKGFKQQSDLQGHSRALAMVPFDRPHIRFLLVFHCNCVSVSCTVSEILTLSSKNLKRSRV